MNDEPSLQTHRAHSARVYNYILGGAENYAADRETAEASLRAAPALRTSMLANRAFMTRAARFLAAECGIRQFLDVGSGIPTSPNLHEVVQDAAPQARVIYVDNDPIVLAHSRALLTSTPQGRAVFVPGDLRDPDALLAEPQLRDTLDLSQPVSLTVIAMVQTIADDAQAQAAVRRLVDAIPAGSYLTMSIPTAEFAPGPAAEVKRQYEEHGEVMRLRTHAEATAFFDGLELVEPGVVQAHKWRSSAAEVGGIDDKDVAMYAGVARKP